VVALSQSPSEETFAVTGVEEGEAPSLKSPPEGERPEGTGESRLAPAGAVGGWREAPHLNLLSLEEEAKGRPSMAGRCLAFDRLP